MKNLSRIHWIQLGLVVMLALSLTLGLTGTAKAAEFDNDGTIEAGETVADDVFLTGKDVRMDGTVEGMLIVTGETITISGNVVGDVLAMGQTIQIDPSAVIDGNVFAAGRDIRVEGKVNGSLFGGSTSMLLAEKTEIARNVYYGGFSLETRPGSTVKKDLFLGAYQGMLSGSVERDLRTASAALELKGSVGRNARLDVESPNQDNFNPAMFNMNMPKAIPSGLRIAPDAKIGGKLTYSSTADQSKAIQAKPQSGVVHITPVPQQKDTTPAKPVTSPAVTGLFNFFRNLVTLLLLGGLALWLMPRLFQRTVDQAEQKPLPAAGTGFVTLLVGFAGAFLAVGVIITIGVVFSLFTLGGLSSAIFGVGLSGLGLAFAIFLLLVNYGSKVVVSYLVGQWVISKLAPQSSASKVLALLSGVFIYALLRSIPFVGWLFGLAATLVGLGAMWLVYRASRTPQAAPAPVEITAA